MGGRAAPPWLVLLGFVTNACALAGYDFDEYHRGNADKPTATTYSVGGDADKPTATTHSVGGAPDESMAGAAGAAGNSQATGEKASAGGCEPRACSILPAACGVIDDGCGVPLDCGPCFWWFEECRQHLCEIVQ